MYAQQPLSQKEQESRLRTVLEMTDSATRERELVRYEPSVGIPLVTSLLQNEKQAMQRSHRLGFVLVAAFLLMILAIRLDSGKFPSTPFFLFFFFFTNNRKKSWRQRLEQLALFLPEWIKRANRMDLGALLELAPLVWEQEVLKTALRDRLAHLLPRTPTDELVLLTPLQRAGLRQITRRAIEEARIMSLYEPLAVAGLLAMGSLRDPGARSAANSALLQHSRGHVCAAAEEYLACL